MGFEATETLTSTKRLVFAMRVHMHMWATLFYATMASASAHGAPNIDDWKINDPIPAFTFVDEFGDRSVFAASKPTLVAFAFSRCAVPDACPKTLAILQQIEKELPAVDIVVVTLDPVYDNPDVLRAWKKHAGLKRARFLTGAADDVVAFTSLFNVFALEQGGSLSHPVKAALLDAQHRIVREWKDNHFSVVDVRGALSSQKDLHASYSQ